MTLLSRIQVAFSLPTIPFGLTLGAGRSSEIDQDKGGEGKRVSAGQPDLRGSITE